ncbi:hypothetical protein DFA_02603 [Cavenderia fasciculata]|uniref:PH domain-containing protein n=1 Tax=Cavenderia fasciculata TaxID=261658 RepID=F4PZV0_CACFS|nr:uncharacterized protein DFA_02603 [Cavenderia fasciculata]EGG18864.1 hypothetical protein DFA_02603 [Cavenderia fasciculata]|eukprot:XP_004357326.1 hypothetical protein DFA_02603 [Cavenderia fasciculata]
MSQLRDSKDKVPPPKHRSIKEGSVTKQGGRIKNWKKRWCVLNDEGIHYFKSQNSIEKGSIAISHILNVESDDKSSSKRKNCFKVWTEERTYRICATDSLDKDEWITSIKRLIKPRSLTNSNGGLKSSQHVDINRLKIENDDSSSESSSFSSSFSLPTTNTIALTPIMLGLKDKFGQPNFALELNKKKDLLSGEEVETVMKLLDGLVRNEIDEKCKDMDKDIYAIRSMIERMKEAEIEFVMSEYDQKKAEILKEINKRQNK